MDYTELVNELGLLFKWCNFRAASKKTYSHPV